MNEIGKPIAGTAARASRFSLLAGLIALLGACAGTKHLEIEGTFPIPLIQKSPVNLGIHLDDALVTYIHTEAIDKKGEWEVSIGPAQQQLFNNLATGVFEGHTFVDGLIAEAPLDGVLRPTITEVQFSLPSQTRSDYYEVWIRYDFQLYDRAGNLVGAWKLPAYGKASKKNHGSSSNGLQAAAMAACRDAMAFFSINFSREPVVAKWLAAGKPLVPPQPQTQPEQQQPASTPPADATADEASSV
jgi:hypothetical protein